MIVFKSELENRVEKFHGHMNSVVEAVVVSTFFS